MSDIVERLRNTPNWMREEFGSWKSVVRNYDRAPFEAADEIEKLRTALIEINELNSKRLGYSKKIERVIWKALGEKE